MGNYAIQVNNMGKMYRIGGPQQSYDTFREAVTRIAVSPFKKVFDLSRGQAYAAAGLHEEIWALKDIRFDVKHGEVVGIIGRNGAGKSTLLKILSRITDPTEGYADIYGRVGALLEVGTGFHSELTGRENVYLNGAILGMSRRDIDRKFDEIVDFSGVERFIDTPVKHYSSGMGLRLGFAVAAHLEPDILVVDEVLAVGDAEFQKKCLGKMSDVAGEGRTVLFVSHNLSAIQQLCLRVVWLDGGQVHEIGPVMEVSRRYQDQMLKVTEYKTGNIDYNDDETGIEIKTIGSSVEIVDNKFELEVKVTGYNHKETPRFGIGLNMYTANGEIIAKLWPKMIESWIEGNPGEWKCAIRFNNLSDHLTGGEYLFDLRVFRPNQRKGTMFIIERVLEVDLPQWDAFNIGEESNWFKHGPAILPASFKIINDED